MEHSFPSKNDGNDFRNWTKEQLWTAIDLQRNIFHDNNHYAVEVLEVSLYTAPMCHFSPGLVIPSINLKHD